MDKPLIAVEVPARQKPSNYPEPFASRMKGRIKRPLGDLFSLKSFGVNLTELLPQAESALLHKHSKQEEFIYIVSGEPTLVLDDKEFVLKAGMCMGFSPSGPAHKLVNRSQDKVFYLEMGNRVEGDEGSYPADDLVAVMKDGAWVFVHKDGSPY